MMNSYKINQKFLQNNKKNNHLKNKNPKTPRNMDAVECTRRIPMQSIHLVQSNGRTLIQGVCPVLSWAQVIMFEFRVFRSKQRTRIHFYL